MHYLIIKSEGTNVTAARIEISGKSATLGGAASFVCDEANSLASIVQRIAEGTDDSPRVVLCLSPSLFAGRVVELPLTDVKKVREVLPAHLQGDMILAPEEVVFDALPIAKGKFLAVWSKKAEIAQAVELFTSAGMVPQIVSSEPFAWHHLPGIPADAAVCDGNTLAVIQDGATNFIRTLEPGDLEAQVAAIFTALSMSGVVLPPRLLVFGERGEALLAADLPVPASRLELPDEYVKVFRTEATFQQLAGLYAVAYGNHCGGLPDFRRGELAWTAGDARLRKMLRLAAVLTVVTVVLLFVSKGLQYRAVRADIASLDRSILSIYREVFPSRTRAVDELSEIKGEIRKLSGGDTAGTALDIIKVLAEAKGTTINGLYEAEVEGRILRLKGDARSAQAVNDFKAAISPLMTSVELGEVKSRPDGTVAFVISGTVREAAK